LVKSPGEGVRREKREKQYFERHGGEVLNFGKPEEKGTMGVRISKRGTGKKSLRGTAHIMARKGEKKSHS